MMTTSSTRRPGNRNFDITYPQETEISVPTTPDTVEYSNELQDAIPPKVTNILNIILKRKGENMYGKIKEDFQKQLQKIQSDGYFKDERIIASAQGVEIFLTNGEKILNFCANNYLGLSNNKKMLDRAMKVLDERGYGMSSVRFICGTQDIHRELENKISEFLGTEDTILYSSCFDANGGLFETLFQTQDAIISDALNHASIIDGIP